MKKTVIVFGSLSALILLLFQLEKWSLFALGWTENYYLILSGMLFFILGIIISRYVYFRKEQLKKERVKSSLSSQELKVLSLIAEGHSTLEWVN